MANIKKLSQEQEYRAAFLHYLGHSQEDLAKRFQVSPALIYQTYKKYKSKVMDELKGVVTPDKTSFERNLEYVVSRIKQDEYSIHDSKDTESSLVAKLFKESLKKIKFKEYMEPRSGYDNLITAVLGDKYYFEGGALRVFSDYLSNLNLNQKNNKNKLVKEFSEELKERLRKGYFAIEVSDLKKKVIEDTLTTLTEREAKILKLYFGLDGKGLTLRRISDLLNLSHERVRQIKEKGIRRLRHASRAKPLIRLYGDSDEELSQYIIELKVNERIEEELLSRQIEKKEVRKPTGNIY